MRSVLLATAATALGLAVPGGEAATSVAYYRVVAAQTSVTFGEPTIHGPLTETISTKMRAHAGTDAIARRRGLANADGHGTRGAFGVAAPVTGSYLYSGHFCTEAYALSAKARLSVTVAAGIATFTLHSPLPAGYAAAPCRPPGNNAEVWHNEHPQAQVTVTPSLLAKSRFTITSTGTESVDEGTLVYRYTVTIVRLQRR